MHHVLGQDRAVVQLQAALAADRLHHAYIFHGPQGVGKFTTAAAFARILLCHHAQPDLTGRIEACGHCPSCKLMAHAEGRAMAHPDFHLVTKELALYSDDANTRDRKLITIPVEVLRQELIGPAYRSAQLRHGKVMIVDEAELMAPVGQNALLKVLEEPPAGTVIILLTASQDKLLPTLRSRCHAVPFVPLSDDTVHRWLDEHPSAPRELTEPPFPNQKPEIRNQKFPPPSTPNSRFEIRDPKSDSSDLVSFAAGSIGRALLARDYQLDGWARDILPAVDQSVQGKYPAGLGARIAESINDFALEWVERHKKENASKDAANKLGARLMWSMIARHAAQRLAQAAGRARPGDLEGAEALANPWLAVIDALGRAEYELATNVNPSIVADHAVAGMSPA